MYREKKFRVRSLEAVKADLRSAAPYRNQIQRIFLCDGDALAVPMPYLTGLLEEIKTLFPNLEAVRVYASARNILDKKPEDLKTLAALGIDLAYIGLESGSDKVLAAVNKGLRKQEMIDASIAIKEAGIKQSVSIISGLVEKSMSEEHILETADALNKMQPDYLGMLVLHGPSNSQLVSIFDREQFRIPPPDLILSEMRLLLEHLELDNCFFSSAHISNYITLRGRLPGEKRRLIELLDNCRVA
jgi:radical SAM superfamily enzyme YgiQ (UPF0313 family)